jgi:hypothetical protein
MYAVASGPSKKVVSVNDIETIMKMKASTIALTSPFFVSTGLLTRSDKGFVPSDAVMNFQRAWQWNPERAAHKLAPVLASTWFAQRLMPMLSYRMVKVEDAINELAEACHAVPEYAPKLQVLIEYLITAGLVRRDGDSLVLGPSSGAAPEPTAEAASPSPDAETATPSVPPKSTITTGFSQPTEGTVQFHVSVSVDMAEFAGWKPERIAAFFNGIAQVLAAKGAIEKGSAG